jgi:hypothetical protein
MRRRKKFSRKSFAVGSERKGDRVMSDKKQPRSSGEIPKNGERKSNGQDGPNLLDTAHSSVKKELPCKDAEGNTYAQYKF